MAQPLVNWVNVCLADVAEGVAPAEGVDDLASGERFAAVLEFTLGGDLPPLSVHRGSDNSVMHRSNVSRVAQAVADYAVEYLNAPSSAASVVDAVDAAKIARDKDPDAIVAFGHLIVAVSVLSGNPAVIEKVRTLPKAEQEELQRAVKAAMAAHSISKRKKGAGAGGGNASASPAPPPDDGPVSRVSNPETRILAEEKAELQRQLTEARDALGEAARSLEALQRDHADIVARYNRTVDQAASGDTARVREQRLELERLGAEVEELSAESTRLRRADDEARAALAAAEAERARLVELGHGEAAGRRAAEDRAAALQSEAAGARDLEAAANRRRDGLQAEAAELGAANSALRRELTEARAAGADAEAAAERRGAEAAAAEARIAAMAGTAVDAEAQGGGGGVVDDLRAQLREERAAAAAVLRRQEEQSIAAAEAAADSTALAAARSDAARSEHHLQRALGELANLRDGGGGAGGGGAGGGGDEATRRLREAVEESAALKDALEAAHRSFRQQHAAANAAVIEAGQTSMRLQQQLLAGGAAVPPHELLALRARDGEHTVLHTMRRRMELGVLRSLSQHSHGAAPGAPLRSPY